MRAALFDLDDTILDRSGTLQDFVEWQATGMLRSSIDNIPKFVDRFIELDERGTVWKDKVYEQLIQEFSITDWTAEELLNTYLLTFCAFCRPRTGALAAIEEFREYGYKIGLVSNGKTPFQERNFRALGWESMFDCVVVSEAVGISKPSKAIFEWACRTVNSNIETSFFIGDNPNADIEGAKNAGMKTIYVPVNPNADRCEFADVTFSDLTELPNYIKRVS